MKDHNKTFRMAARLGVNPRSAANLRIRYLKDRYKELQKFPQSEAKIWMQDIMEEIDYLNKQVVARIQQPGDKITDTMVNNARDYPIDQLIDFTRGSATAWCHNDKSPSLAHLTRINKAKCFVCDKVFDSIDVYMEQMGCDFVTAVRSLSR